jgi:hypothetical protein
VRADERDATVRAGELSRVEVLRHLRSRWRFGSAHPSGARGAGHAVLRLRQVLSGEPRRRPETTQHRGAVTVLAACIGRVERANPPLG